MVQFGTSKLDIPFRAGTAVCVDITPKSQTFKSICFTNIVKMKTFLASFVAISLRKDLSGEGILRNVLKNKCLPLLQFQSCEHTYGF